MKTVLDRGFVAVIDEPNSDLKVVNAARVSFSKKSETFTAKDANLISYLAANRHWTPFAHCRAVLLVNFDAFGSHEETALFMSNLPGAWFSTATGPCLFVSLAHAGTLYEAREAFRESCPVSVDAMPAATRSDLRVLRVPAYSASDPIWGQDASVTLHMKMPVFVARQWMRSNVGIVYNEVSRRYVDDEPEFYSPDRWRARPEKSVKQGSSDDAVDLPFVPSACGSAAEEYRSLLDAGVAPEQARVVLPVAHYTEFWMTCSLRAIARVLALRMDRHAQRETREYANATFDMLVERYPILTRLVTKERS